MSYSFSVEGLAEFLLASFHYLALLGDPVVPHHVLLVSRVQQLDSNASFELRLPQQVSYQRFLPLGLLVTQSHSQNAKRCYEL